MFSYLFFIIVLLKTYVSSVYLPQFSDTSISAVHEPEIHSPESETINQQESVHEESAWRIVGGHNCSVKDVPFIVSIIELVDKSHYCGGSLVTPRLVLTTAHGFYKIDHWPEVFKVVVGSSRTLRSRKQILNIERIIMHEEYEDESIRNDIAFLHLAKEVILYLGAVDIVKLPKHILPDDLSEICDPDSFEVAGWGDTRPLGVYENRTVNIVSPQLQCVNLRYITTEKSLEYFHPDLITKNIMCTLEPGGGKDKCYGDSGGPLFCEGVQYGIASFGAGCGALNGPGCYTRVDRYLDFIHRTLRGGNCGNIKFEKFLFLPRFLICFILLTILT